MTKWVQEFESSHARGEGDHWVRGDLHCRVPWNLWDRLWDLACNHTLVWLPPFPVLLPLPSPVSLGSTALISCLYTHPHLRIDLGDLTPESLPKETWEKTLRRA